MNNQARDLEEFGDVDQDNEKKKKLIDIYFELTCFFGRLTMMIMLYLVTLKISYSISWVKLGLIQTICSVVVLVIGNMWINQKPSKPIANFVISVTLNSSVILLLLFCLLTYIRLDGSIKLHTEVIMLPLFFLDLIALLFIIFLTPGLQYTNYNNATSVVFTYYVSLILAQVATIVVLALSTRPSWFFVTSFVLVALAYNLIVALQQCGVSKLWSYVWLTTLIYTLVMFTLLLNNDTPSDQDKYILMVPICIVSTIEVVKQLI